MTAFTVVAVTLTPEREVSWILAYIVVAWVIRAAMVPVVLRRQFAPGAAIAWLVLIFLHPYIGLSFYLLIGESPVGRRRAVRHRELVDRLRPGPPEISNLWGEIDAGSPYRPMVVQAEKVGQMPVLGGNDVTLHDDATKLIDALVADIAAAERYVHLLYFIFACDGEGRRVARALTDASKRGVKCRVIADAVASRAFFHRRHGLARPLAHAGVEVVPALPVAPIRRKLPRMDVRNHRKLAIVDGLVAYAGSHNLINPDYGGRRGGPWHDLSARITGPAVGELATVFIEDWMFETGMALDLDLPTTSPASDGTAVQVVPTGPAVPGETFRRILLAAVQSAQKTVTLTTPYFVPDEPTLVALQMAADRGVVVTLIVPEVSDHPVTAAAGRAHFARLLESGVNIHLFQRGLVHAKTTTVDDAFGILGSANLDVRSFNLNFELSVLVYGESITRRLREAQQKYLARSRPLTIAEWSARPVVRQYAESAVSLLSPLL